MFPKRFIILGITLFFCFTKMLFAQQTARKFKAGRTENTHIMAVPNIGQVKIDGKLDDWDLSGGILTSADVNNFLNEYSAWVYMMYDSGALYVAAHITDKSPMVNGYDPETESMIVHRGDCFFLRFKENKKVTNLFAYYWSIINQPAIVAADGVEWFNDKKYSNGIKLGIKEAFQKDSDGKGYIQELRIPWSIITESNRVPCAGENIPALLGIYWSGSGPRDHFKYNSYDLVGAGQPLPVAYFWRAGDVWGDIVLSPKGNLKQPLPAWLQPIPDEPRPLEFSYQLPADGEVSIALVNEQGKMVRHIVSQAYRKAGTVTEHWNGLDDVGNTLPPGNYTWKGIYHEPIKTKYIMGLLNHGDPSYKVEDGTGQWGADHGEPPTAVAAAGQEMLLAWSSGEAGSPLIKTDLNGKKKIGKSIGIGAEYMTCDSERIYMSNSEDPQSVVSCDINNARPLLFGNGGSKISLALSADGTDVKVESDHMAYSKGVTLFGESVTKSKSSITGLACANDILYVSYGGRNMIALFNSKQGTLIETWTLNSPGQLAINPSGHLIAVSNNRIVELTNGKTKSIISDKLDFPSALAVDRFGQIYVANKGSLQNVSVFSSKGRFIRSIGEKGGRSRIGKFNKQGMLQPNGLAIDAKGRLWVAEHDASPKRFSVWNVNTGDFVFDMFGAADYVTEVSIDPQNPTEAICLNTILDIDLEKGNSYPKSTFWYLNPPRKDMISTYSSPRIFTAKNGRQYAFYTGWGNPGMLFMREGLVLKPIVTVVKDALWQDKNNDQVIQPGECVHGVKEKFVWVDENLTLWSDKGWKLSPSAFEANGQPVYDVAKIEKLPPMYMNSESDIGLFTNNSGTDIYCVENSTADKNLKEIRGYSSDGSERWFYHTGENWTTSLHQPIPVPGVIYGVTKPLGVAGNFIGVATYFGVFDLLTTDGLFVAKIFHDGREGILGPETICAELFAGQLVQIEKSGKFYLLVGDTDGRITEITGLNSIKRFEGNYTITSEAVSEVEKAWFEYKSFTKVSDDLTLFYGEHTLGFSKSVSRQSDDNRGFKAKVAYDENNLYVQYEVASPSELTNAIVDPNTVFKGGNLIDIQIATKPYEGNEARQLIPGDIRLLVSRQSDRQYAVLFKPKVAGFKGKPIVLTSPTGKEQFDAVEVVSQQIKLDYAKHEGGFTAKIIIPHNLTGWKPTSGKPVEMDLGYLFGTPTGNACGLRLYWNNKSFAAGVIGDVPNESRLEPEQWGKANVE